MVQQLRVDTAKIGDLVKGLVDGAAGKDAQSQIAYVEGLKIGQMMAESWVSGLTADVYADDSTKSVDKDNLVAGFIAGVLGKDMKMSVEDARDYVQAVMEAANEKQMEAYAFRCPRRRICSLYPLRLRKKIRHLSNMR